MRTAQRLYAALASSSSNYLTPHTPTGLTGILTHPFPRPALIYIYSSTLDKLSRLPKDSVYRQSTEALTRHRLNIIESEVPPGFTEWQNKIESETLPKLESGEIKALGDLKHLRVQNRPYLFHQYVPSQRDDREVEWNGERDVGERGEGTRDAKFRAMQAQQEGGQIMEEQLRGEAIENEPPLTRDQVGALEEKLGSGLIEEVIEVARREHDLVDIMLENKVYVWTIGYECTDSIRRMLTISPDGRSCRISRSPANGTTSEGMHHLSTRCEQVLITYRDTAVLSTQSP